MYFAIKSLCTESISQVFFLQQGNIFLIFGSQLNASAESGGGGAVRRQTDMILDPEPETYNHQGFHFYFNLFNLVVDAPRPCSIPGSLPNPNLYKNCSQNTKQPHSTVTIYSNSSNNCFISSNDCVIPIEFRMSPGLHNDNSLLTTILVTTPIILDVN